MSSEKGWPFIGQWRAHVMKLFGEQKRRDAPHMRIHPAHIYERPWTTLDYAQQMLKAPGIYALDRLLREAMTKFNERTPEWGRENESRLFYFSA
jgi:hypothetical protein